MNILHLKYVISIAENGSINKAAEELHVAQPNLSRVVKEMEADLGIQFFRRSSKGMMLTPDGELFVNQARKILEQIDEMESMYKEKKAGEQRFSISVPRATPSPLSPKRWGKKIWKSFIRKPTRCRR